MIFNPAEFRREIERINVWWVTGDVPETKKYPYHREVFSKIKKEMEERRITILLGPRRTGKSVLVKQLLGSLITEGVNPTSILYYSLDDPSLFAHSNNLIKDLIDYHEENIAETKKRYIVLDEVHSFPDWYKWIKAYYDRDLPLKFILTGSSSLALQKDANRYLTGRSMEYSLYPLSLGEFLELSGLKTPRFVLDDLYTIPPLEVSRLWHEIKSRFNEYILVGGFPEWFEVRHLGVERWFLKLINDIPKKAIYEDTAQLFGIKSPRVLELIFTFIISNQSRILAYETINEIANLDRTTLVNYIEFLKNSYLLVEILKFAKLKEQLKAKKKFLAVDQGIRNAILKDYTIKEENIGFIIENIIGLKCYLSRDKSVFYLKTDGEIDYILRDKETIPIEVKYRSYIRDKDITRLVSFMDKNNTRRGIIITKDIYQKKDIGKSRIYFIPAWLFLLASL